jgi:UDP-N-acetylmuramoyl-tripeptide--D-alanyl-D-alanine ligase
MDRNENLLLTFSEMAQVTGAQMFNRTHVGLPSTAFNRFTYDSRKVLPYDIFFCIAGNQVDGHDYIDAAIMQGGICVFGDNREKIEASAKKYASVCFAWVPNVLAALHQLAKYYRQKFTLPCVGVAGSSGKTTTKDLIGSIFKIHGPSLATESSFNNQWGLPQTVLRLRANHFAAVFEVGTNHFGEVAALSDLCHPTIGIITTIGKEHLEFLVDEAGVLRANAEMFDWMRQHEKMPLFLFNGDSLLLKKMYSQYRVEMPGRALSYSLHSNDTDVVLESSEPLGIESGFGWHFILNTPWGTVDATLPLPGAHNLENAVAATTAALATGLVSPEEVAAGLSKPSVSHLRSELIRLKNGPLIYNDTYNANPTSFAALFSAGKNLRKQTSVTEVIAVVGDMLELGNASAEFHREMGREAAHQGIDWLVSVGEFSLAWVEGFQSVSNHPATRFHDQKSLLDALVKHGLKSTTLILVKGSRGAKMEQIVHDLKVSFA